MAAVAAKFLSHIRGVRPSWKADSVKFSQITCALSNQVFCVSHGSEKVLLRVYGSTDHGLFTREEEVRQTSFLAGFGFGPQILDTFEEGRIESWVNGRTPSNGLMRSSSTIRTVAQKLRLLHDKTGLNHNDLHRNNMLLADDGNVELLDFEYSGEADPTYDIANHFCEWMYPYTGEDQHIPQAGLYPSLRQRTEFCSHYLGETSGKGAHYVADFVREVETRKSDVHAFWIEWADRTPNEFNVMYAQARRDILESESSSSSPTEFCEPRSTQDMTLPLLQSLIALPQLPQLAAA